MISSAMKNWLAFLGAGLATLAGASLYFDNVGTTDASITRVLEITGRCAFVLFLVVFVARPLRQLKPSPLTSALLRNRRLLGVAFAGMHFAHLGLIFYRASQNTELGFPSAGDIPGATAYLFIALMFITSFDSLARALGPKRWRWLHTAGLYYVFIVFDVKTVMDLANQIKIIGRVDESAAAVLILAIAALAIRLQAAIRKRRG